MEKKVNDVIDIEDYAKSGQKVPKGKKYQIRIDREKYVVESECMTGNQILEIAGKIPPGKYQLNQKIKSGEVKKIGYDEQVCFTDPGIERFMTLPLDSTEG